MNWDYPIHSFTEPNHEPQTPTRTPTTSSFEASFQTPKLESSFYDPRVTWNTTDPYGSSPELSKEVPPRFDLASPSPQRGRFSGFGADAKKGLKASYPISSSVDDVSDGIDGTNRSAASMQTPPPTSSSRRRMQDPMSLTTHDVATPTQQFGGTQSHLETPSRFVGLSPNFYGFQGTPDLFRVAGASTTESPSSIPRYQMPWDRQSSTTVDRETYIHHFHVEQAQPSVGPFDADSTSEIGLETPRLPVTRSIDRRQAVLGASQDPQYLDTHQIVPISSSLAASPRVPTRQDEDPSMFLSSPARRFGFSDPSYSPNLPRTRPETRQPYHYQMEESERDDQERGLCKVPRIRNFSQPWNNASFPASNTIDREPYTSLSSSNSNRLLPRRTATYTCNISRQSSLTAGGSNVVSGPGVRKTPSKGRTSPFKMQRHRPLSLAAPMEALVLKIGRDGIATTEMKLAEHLQPQLLNTSPETSVEELSTESEGELSDTPQRRIQNPSHAFPNIIPRRPRISRTPSISRPDSKSSSRSSAGGSTHSGYANSCGWSDVRRHSMFPLSSHSRNYSITDSEATQDNEEADETGDAQYALKQVLEARKRQPPLTSSSASSTKNLALHSTPPSASASIGGYGSATRASRTLAMATLRSSPPLLPYSESYADIDTPTKTDSDSVRTPTSERRNNPSTGTRCICNSRNNGGHLMIQCEACTHWLHTKCVGLDRSSLPPVYICVYCVSTPARQRVRDPRENGSSPLSHKTYNFF